MVEDDLTPTLVFPILVSHDFRCAVPSSPGGLIRLDKEHSLYFLKKSIILPNF